MSKRNRRKRNKRKQKLTPEERIRKRIKQIDNKALRDVRFSVIPNTTYWNKGK
tara:strand:- start:612 stop:770 length:159 start_codon:yes stop_codon:yes gene_type:complete